MSAVAANKVPVADYLNLTAVQKGTLGNVIYVKARVNPTVTGATVVTESGNNVLISYKTADGAAISETASGASAAINAQSRLITAALTGAGAPGDTGAAFSGASGTGVALVSGADGTYGYDDLSAATTDGWALTNKVSPSSQGNVDVLEKVDRIKGGRVRVAAAAATGATNVIQVAYNEEKRRALDGKPRSLMGVSGSEAYEYSVTP